MVFNLLKISEISNAKKLLYIYQTNQKYIYMITKCKNSLQMIHMFLQKVNCEGIYFFEFLRFFPYIRCHRDSLFPPEKRCGGNEATNGSNANLPSCQNQSTPCHSECESPFFAWTGNSAIKKMIAEDGNYSFVAPLFISKFV